MSEVTPLPTEEQTSTTPTPLSIVKVFEEMQEWRRTRPLHGQYNIPDPLWEKIFTLAEENGASKIRQIFGISGKQFNAKRTELTKRKQATVPPAPETMPSLSSTVKPPLPSTPPIDWCEVLGPASLSKPSDPYDEVPIATHTLIVEFRRHDGKIMTIHTTTRRVGEIMQSFFNEI